MSSPTNRLRLSITLAFVWLAGFTFYATTLDAAPAQGYARANFAFDGGAHLKASVSGTTATLVFDKPVSQSAASIRTALPGYVTAVSVSTDKHTVMLTLTKPYRLRQFVSGKGVGIDLIGEPSGEVANAAAKPAAKEAKEKPAAAAKPAPHTEDALLSTKHNVPPAKPAAEKPTPAAKAPAAKTATPPADAMLSTKHETPEPTKKPDAESATTAPKNTTASASEATAPATQAIAPAKAKPNGPFVVTARTVNGETTINFPWSERTGAAVFRRGHDIWIVFSRLKNVNATLLGTVMPKQIVNVTQYAYPNNTVLRLITDGTLYARGEQVKGGYGWNVVLSQSFTPPALDVSLAADTLEGTSRLILGAYDVAPTVRFFDPNAGDELIVVPSYENGRGVTGEHNYPEISVLAANQGIAIITKRHDVSTSQSRTGFILSSPEGLAISESLPLVAGSNPVPGGIRSTGTVLAYDQWYVPPDKFHDTEMDRLHTVATATKSAKADALFELAKLYLASGMGTEALGPLGLIQRDYHDYYVANKLALLSAASHVMNYHMDEAAKDLQAPELTELDEANPWREVVAQFAPPPSTVENIQGTSASPNDASANNALAPQAGGPAPATATAAPVATGVVIPPVPPAPPGFHPLPFHFLKYNKLYIHFYPPRVRQRLAVIAADAYIANGEEEKALAAFDTLVHDDIADPVKDEADFALGAVAAKKGEIDEALKTYDRLAKQNDNRRVAVKARYAAALLRYKQGKLTAPEASDILENTRLGWRGDAIDHAILLNLIGLYTDQKRYDDELRTYRAILDGFPNDPETFATSGQMSDLFQRIFLDGLADDMQPLKALSLFYEFRDLTPLGDNGDKIIQKLADRLAAIDLLDRATQLLDNQVRFRATGENRSQIGARLALLHILNQHPQEALDILEITNYGENKPELRLQRQELTAEALMKLGKYDEAVGVISNDTSKAGSFLRLEILWAMKDWPSVVNHAEDILGARANLTEPLTPEETGVLLKLSLAYAFEGDYTQLRYLRDYYSGLIPNSRYKQIFDYITNDTTPLDPEDFNMLAAQISHTESFLDTFKTKIAAGKLSEAVQ